MNRERKLYYYKNVVKRHLKQLIISIKTSKNEMERRYYIDRFDVQLNIYAKALNVQERHLKRYIPNHNAKEKTE